MSFRYWNAWDVIFFDTDRMRTALPRRARFNSDEALIDFAQRAGGIKMSEDRQILDMMIQRKTGEITLNLTDEPCDEGMEHARAFLTSAGEAVSNIENHDPRLLLREFVVLFRIFAAHSATCPKCNQVSVADSTVSMPRMTAELFREILDSIEGDVETLEIEKTVSEGEDVPTQAERSAIERVQSTLKQSKAAIEVELEMKG